MNNRLIASLAALALLLVGLLAWYVSTLEKRTVNYVTPARNAAAYNPLFVLEQALHERKQAVSSHRYFGTIEQPLMPGDTVVMLADGRQLNSRQARQLADAVEQGLHLVALQPASRRKQAATDPGRLLQQLGFRANPACAQGRCDQRLLPPDGASVEQEDYRHLGARIGHGRVDLFSSLDFLRTGKVLRGREQTGIAGFAADGLANPANQRRAWQLLAPNLGNGHIYLIYDQRQDRWWMRLLSQGVMTWLPLALLLAGWLWARSQRLGPLLPDPEPARRSLREHIMASAHLLWRNRRGLSLYDQALAALHTRIASRAPALSGLQGVALEQALALRTGIDARQLASALRRPQAHDKAALAQRITVLMETRNLL